MRSLSLLLVLLHAAVSRAFIPLIDGGKTFPKLYDAYFNDQICKQASTAVSRAISAGKRNIQVEFPAVPNVEEVKFGTPLNLKFGKTTVARDLKIKGGYKPGSNISRNLVAYSNVYWGKRIASALKGPVGFLTAEPVDFSEIGNLGDIKRVGSLTQRARAEGRPNESIIVANPGGEETWPRLVSAYGEPNCPFVVMNNAYSTSYDIGNKKGFEEAYYLKRISRGFVFRAFPGPWQAVLEKPDGSTEVLKEYKDKPRLREVAELVREESFKRYAIGNDRWMSGRM